MKTSQGIALNKLSVNEHISYEISESQMVDIGDREDHKTKGEYRDIAEANGAKTSHDKAKEVPITNKHTYDKYLGIIKDFGRFCCDHGAGRDPSGWTNKYVEQFLTDKLESGYSFKTLNNIPCALNKWAEIHNSATGDHINYDKPIAEFRAKIEDLREDYKNSLENRAFEDPQKIVDNMPSEKGQFAASMALNYGLRASNCIRFELNLKDASWTDKHGNLHEAKAGTLHVVSKNHYVRENFEVSKEDFAKLEKYAEEARSLGILKEEKDVNGNTFRQTFNLPNYNYNKFNREVKKSARACGVDEQKASPHSFRFNYAQYLYDKLRSEGMTDKQAKYRVSHALFHGRLDITERYLGGR